jgi:hypothetical protein
MSEIPGIDPAVPPSGTGCVECNASGGWWVHLRRCTQCGHIGCCDSSPSRHASAHAKIAGARRGLVLELRDRGFLRGPGARSAGASSA